MRASELIFIAGQLATDVSGRIVGKDDFDAQMKQVLSNIEKALKSVEASFANVVQFTTYLVHAQDIANFRRVREELFPTMFPTHRYPPIPSRSRSARPRGFSHRNRDDGGTLAPRPEAAESENGGELAQSKDQQWPDKRIRQNRPARPPWTVAA